MSPNTLISTVSFLKTYFKASLETKIRQIEKELELNFPNRQLVAHGEKRLQPTDKAQRPSLACCSPRLPRPADGGAESGTPADGGAESGRARGTPSNAWNVGDGSGRRCAEGCPRGAQLCFVSVTLPLSGRPAGSGGQPDAPQGARARTLPRPAGGALRRPLPVPCALAGLRQGAQVTSARSPGTVTGAANRLAGTWSWGRRGSARLLGSAMSRAVSSLHKVN